MRFVTYLSQGQPAVGLVDAQDRVRPLGDVLPGEWPDLVSVIEQWSNLAGLREETSADGFATPVTELALLAPIPRPRRNIFCVGKNYSRARPRVRWQRVRPERRPLRR